MSRPFEIPSEPDGIVQAPVQQLAAAPVDSDMAVATDEQVGSVTLGNDTMVATDEQVGSVTMAPTDEQAGSAAMAPTNDVDGETAPATDEQAAVDLRWQAHPEAVPSRCSCCGKPGWLVSWVLQANARPRSLRRLLAQGGPQGR